jgi:hypothetical protein
MPAQLRVIAAGGIVAVLAYLVFPTGASAIEQQTQLFAVNLRYATPAIAIGLLLAVVVFTDGRPHLVTPLAVLMLAVVLATQLQAQLWPRQTARHVAFLVAAALVVLALWAVARTQPRSTALRVGLAGAAILCVVAGFAVQRHYFTRRYLSSVESATPQGQIDRWAQGIANTSLALYGTVEQYPLYGARVTNRVHYLGQPAADGGYEPIATCAAWRRALHQGRYRYVVLTPAPTKAIPLAWTADDHATRLLQPAPGYDIFELNPSTAPTSC